MYKKLNLSIFIPEMSCSTIQQLKANSSNITVSAWHYKNDFKSQKQALCNLRLELSESYWFTYYCVQPDYSVSTLLKKCDLFNKSHEYDDGSTETFFNIFNSAELFYKMINEILYDGYEQHYVFEYFIEQFNARIYPLCFQIEYNV